MIFCPLWAGLVALVGDASAQGLTAEQAARSALARDPVYLSAVAATEEAEGLLRATSFLTSNPTVSTAVSLGTPRWSASVEQPVSLFGEGMARRAGAKAAVTSAALDRQRVALVVAAAARGAWADVAAAEARRRLSEDALAQAHDRRLALEARFAAGDASALDARLARLAEAEAALALMEHQRAVSDARVALSRFLPDAATAPILGAPEEAVPSVRGGGSRTDVEAAAARVAGAEADLRAARAAILPAVGLGAAIEREGDNTFVGPTLEVTLPLWKANPDGRAAARAALHVAQASSDAVARVAEAERATTQDAVSRSTKARDALAGEPAADAKAALADIDLAEAKGELDAATATLLRQQVLDGAMAAISFAQAVVHAELDALLAVSDPSLLPLESQEVSP